VNEKIRQTKQGRRHKAKDHYVIRVMPGRRVRFRGNRQFVNFAYFDFEI
jgi:hypothetical protein